jgi:hypothetical protein
MGDAPSSVGSDAASAGARGGVEPEQNKQRVDQLTAQVMSERWVGGRSRQEETPASDLYVERRRMKFEVSNSRQFELPRVTRLSSVLDRKPQFSV